jgi:integrase/recombinase XerD
METNYLLIIACNAIYAQFFGDKSMYSDDYLLFMKNRRDASEETLKAYAHDLDLYLRFLAVRKIRLTKVRPKHVSAYLAYIEKLPGRKPGENASRGTIVRRIAVVASFHNWLALETNGKVLSPVLKLHRTKRRKGKPKPIPDRSSYALEHNVSNPRDRILFKMFLASGLRLSELRKLNADSIRLEIYQVFGEDLAIGIGEIVGKGDKERVFLVDRNTYDEMSEYLDARKASGSAPLFLSNRRLRISKRAIQYVLSRWCKRLDLPAHHIHQLRHTALTRLAESGVPLLILRELAGHVSAETTLGYVKITKIKVIREYFAAMEKLKHAA